MMIPALWQIASRQWRTHRLRVAMTTLGIALGVAVFFAIRTANAALLESLTLAVERLAGKSTLEVTAGEAGFPEQTLDLVRATAGVQLAEPVIEVIVHTALQDEGNILILGVDTTGDQQLRQYDFDKSATQVADPLTYLAEPHAILLSRSFADRHGLQIGSHLPIFTPNGKTDFVVEGIFQPTGVGEVFGGNIAVMDIYSAQVVFNRGHNFDRIDLMNAPAVPVDEVQRRLRAQLPAGIDVIRPEMKGEALENAVTAMRLGMMITSFIALLVGVYIIFNSFTIAVNQRWKEIGILRAIGVERRNINAMFLGEALCMGVVGSIVGIVAGFFIAAVANKMMGSIAASVYGIVSIAVAPKIHWEMVFTSAGLGIAASLGGAWMPARAASYLDPILALHNIESRQKESALGWGRAFLGAALLGISILLIQYSPLGVGMDFQFSYAALQLIGLTMLLPLLVHWAARALRPAMDRMGGSEGALAVDAMIQSPRRSAATVGALMVGLMFVYSTAAYIQSYKHMIARWTDQMLNADLFVATSTLLRSTSYHFSEDLGNRIAALPEVARIENVRFTVIPYRGDTSALSGADMAGFLARSSSAVIGGNRRMQVDLLPQGKGVLVSRNFATRWDNKVGDVVHIDTPTGPLDLPILGLIEDYRSDKGTIFIDRSLYKHYWKDDAVDFIDVTLKPAQDPIAVKRKIEQLTAGSEHAIVYTNVEFRDWIGSLVDKFFLLNYMQLVVAVIVAVVGIANTLIISVAERRREFGIIRAIGGYQAQIRKMVLLEAFSISVVGVIVGVVGALFNIQFLSRTVSTVLAGYDVPFYFPWLLILESFPAVVAVALLAGWIPARHAMKTPVIEAIGYE
jgi:putative ABC transport system permease protein